MEKSRRDEKCEGANSVGLLEIIPKAERTDVGDRRRVTTESKVKQIWNIFLKSERRLSTKWL